MHFALILTLFLPLVLQQPKVRTISQDEAIKHKQERHKLLKSARVSDLVNILSDDSMFAYMKGRTRVIDITPILDNYNFIFYPVKFGSHTVVLSSRQGLTSDRSYNFEIKKTTEFFLGKTRFDTLLTRFNKNIYDEFVTYLHSEGFKPKVYPKEVEYLKPRDRIVYDREGKEVVIYRTDSSLICNFSTTDWR